jgi:hypothetical protein
MAATDRDSQRVLCPNFLYGQAGVMQAAQKGFRAVILSVAKDLALCIFMEIRDSSSPAAPQNDSPDGFFRSLYTPVA